MAKILTYGDGNGSRNEIMQAPKGLSGPLNNPTVFGSDSVKLSHYVSFPKGAVTLNFVAPFDMRIEAVTGVKTSATGGPGDKVELLSGTTVISKVDLNAVTASTGKPGSLVVAAAEVVAGTSLSVKQTQVTDAACSIYITYTEV